MNEQIIKIKQNADHLRLSLIRNEAESIIHTAQINKPSYLEYTYNLLESEVQRRKRTDLERRIKAASLPRHHELDNYDFKVSSSISQKQMKELRELLWVEQMYNVVLMGPSGTGKSYIAAGLINDAVKKGYKAYFTTMEDLISILRMKDLTASALASL
jgi:DNA replication protein DnaC